LIIDFQKFEKDPENMSGKGYPKWLSILLSKYEKMIEDREIGKDIGKEEGNEEEREKEKDNYKVKERGKEKDKKLLTVGKLCAFLSCCAVGQIACQSEEREAFILVGT
jgi:hypothetical protein